MLFLKILLVLTLVVTVLFWVVPKGNFLYELMHLPLWLLKLNRQPKNKCLITKHLYGQNPRQYLLLFRPENGRSEKKHVIFYIHGGGWQFGSPEMFKVHGQALAEAGYFVFMPSHRRIPRYGIRSLREDVANALRKTADLMEAENLGDKTIILGGMSSGGNLAGLLAYDRSLLESIHFDPKKIAAVFLLGAPLDLYKMWRSPPLFMLGGSRNGQRFKEACPFCYIETVEPRPTLLLHGDSDGLVEYGSSVSFYEALKSKTTAGLRFETMPGGIHVDAASWCFEGHQAKAVFFDWLSEMERWEG